MKCIVMRKGECGGGGRWNNQRCTRYSSSDQKNMPNTTYSGTDPSVTRMPAKVTTPHLWKTKPWTLGQNHLSADHPQSAALRRTTLNAWGRGMQKRSASLEDRTVCNCEKLHNRQFYLKGPCWDLPAITHANGTLVLALFWLRHKLQLVSLAFVHSKWQQHIIHQLSGWDPRVRWHRTLGNCGFHQTRQSVSVTVHAYCQDDSPRWWRSVDALTLVMLR